MREDDGARAAILVSNRQHLPVDADGLAALARKALVDQAAGACELSVSFVDEDEMSELHHRYAGEDGPTDVLSFPMDELDVEGTRILGDVVIAPAVAARNNPDDPAGELRLLLVHGVLHVLGYDHEDDASRAEMWALQERYSGVRVR